MFHVCPSLSSALSPKRGIAELHLQPCSRKDFSNLVVLAVVVGGNNFVTCFLSVIEEWKEGAKKIACRFPHLAAQQMSLEGLSVRQITAMAFHLATAIALLQFNDHDLLHHHRA